MEIFSHCHFTISKKYPLEKKEMLKALKNRNREEYGGRIFLSSKEKKRKFIIKEHALKRWNERVGPKTDMDFLTKIINALYHLGRVEIRGVDFGVIDNEIVFTYSLDKDKNISVDTFYGRISLHTSLQDFEALRKYNALNGEKVNLYPVTSLLEKQIFPVIPIEIIDYKYSGTTKFRLEKYETKEGEFYFFLTTKGTTASMKMEFLSLEKLKNHNRTLGLLSYLKEKDWI